MSGAGGDNEESYTVSGLTNGTEVFFYVRAVNALGPSGAVGPANATPVTVVENDDASLSSLALGAGTLDPDFATTTYSYAARVYNNVNRITITPTTTNSGATVTYFDANDNQLTDSASGVTGFQVALAIGENTIKVRVTATDTVTTQTYTVVVTRPSLWTLKSRRPK